MVKAIFAKDFSYSSRRRNVGWRVKAGPEPQSFPQELVDAAVSAGVARIVPPRRAKEAERPDTGANDPPSPVVKTGG